MLQHLSENKQVSLFAVSMSIITTIAIGLISTGETIQLPFGVLDPDHAILSRPDGSTFTVNDMTSFATISGLAFGMYYVVGLGLAKKFRKAA